MRVMGSSKVAILVYLDCVARRYMVICEIGKRGESIIFKVAIVVDKKIKNKKCCKIDAEVKLTNQNNNTDLQF